MEEKEAQLSKHQHEESRHLIKNFLSARSFAVIKFYFSVSFWKGSRANEYPQPNLKKWLLMACSDFGNLNFKPLY